MANPTESEENSLRQSRRELRFIILSWIGCCIWVISYCGLYGYNLEPKDISTVFGFPDWAFWGIALPWIAANAVTFWFCLHVLKNEDDEENME